MSIAGQSVLICGKHASRLAIARSLADAGARVVLHGADDSRDSATTQIEVVTDPLETVEHAEALAARCWRSFGPLAGLVLLEEDSNETFADRDEDWQAALHSRLKLPFFLARAVGLRMQEAGGGCIIHVIASEQSRKAKPPAVDHVIRSASVTSALALAKALPADVRVCAAVGPAAAADVAQTICFLLGSESLGSGVVVRFGASRA